VICSTFSCVEGCFSLCDPIRRFCEVTRPKSWTKDRLLYLEVECLSEEAAAGPVYRVVSSWADEAGKCWVSDRNQVEWVSIGSFRVECIVVNSWSRGTTIFGCSPVTRIFCCLYLIVRGQLRILVALKIRVVTL
jgi:hypothetical protein